MKNHCFIAGGAQKCMLNTLKETLRFFGLFFVSPQRQRFFSITSTVDLLCSDITHISISMYVPPLPSLDICHDHWSLLRQATWPHLFTCLPAFIYCTSMGKHLWAASPDTAHSLWSPKYNRSVQHNMKSDHRSTTKACNVT